MVILSNDYFSNVFPSKKISVGGPASFAKNLSGFLIKSGHVWVGVVSRNEKILRLKIEELKKNNNCQYWRFVLPTRLYRQVTLAKKYKSPEIILRTAIEALKPLIKKTNPDIIFLNGFSLFAWIILRVAYETKISVVMMHAGILRKEIDTYYDFFTKAGKQILYRMEKDISRIAKYEIFLNKWSWRFYNKKVDKVSAKRGVVIPLPYLNREFIASHALKNARKTTHIGMVARWDRIKNHSAALALAKQIKKLRLPWQIHSIALIPKTKRNIRIKKDYVKYISVEPQRDAESLKKFYRKMDLMIVPSHFDVSPGVVMEALLEGTGALISPDVGWIDEFRQAGASEWIIDFSNAEKVVKRIKKLINRPIPKSLINSIKKNHNPNRVFSEYLKIFKKAKKL